MRAISECASSEVTDTQEGEYLLRHLGREYPEGIGRCLADAVRASLWPRRPGAPRDGDEGRVYGRERAGSPGGEN